MLLPNHENSVLVAKGSFRNHFARELRGLKVSLEGLNAPFRRILENRKIANITRPTPVTTGCPEVFLLDAFEEKSLLTLPFAMSSTERGILVFAANLETLASLHDNEESLLLLVAHVGSRLHLESIRRRHAEALAREQITTMQETARTLAHEIVNPLAIVGNYLALLQSRPDVALDIQADLQIIGNELERIGTISGQLNNLATSPAPGSKEPVDIQAIITSTVQLFRKSMPIGKNVCLKTENETALPMILTHRQALQQILLNLLGNSLDAVGTDGWVRVQCRYLPAEDSEHDEIVIEVVDNGPGIAPAVVDRLFRVGYTTKGAGHAGLGLAIVKKLTADLHGRILHSIGEDGETRFILYLPAIKTETT